MDFGWDHPFAAVELVHDRDTDTVYVARCYRLKESTPVEHAAALRRWGKNLNWAWPRDGKRETLEGAGIALAEQYREQGLTMLHECAQFEDGQCFRLKPADGNARPDANRQTESLQGAYWIGLKNSVCTIARTARLSKKATTCSVQPATP